MTPAAALAHFPKITYARFKNLRRYFADWQQAWTAKLPELKKAGWEDEAAQEFVTWRENNPTEKLAACLEREGIAIITLDDKNYPPLLKEIADPPFVLFVRGTLPPAGIPTVAVVGTRACTNYGQQVTEHLAGELAAHGLCIISGLALGIDGLAHQAALEAGGATVAVLGTGLDRRTVYPASHQALSERVIERGGALISEYPPGFKPTQYSFPERNRVIAGLSLGVLVTEAPTESGALITAKCALDYNREVFAVPHPITNEKGAGGNNLIKLGAKMVTAVDDILDELRIQKLEQDISGLAASAPPATPTEAKLLEHLSRQPAHIDRLIKLSGLDSPTVTATLTMLEMKGRVKNLGGMQYVVR